jgi:hypothetical protein
MDNLLRAFIIFSVAFFVVLIGFYAIKIDVLRDDFPERIEISKPDRVYSPGEDVIVMGKANPECEIFLSWSGKVGLVESDKNGNWAANLGIMPEGKYGFQAISNGPHNSQSISSVQIIVEDNAEYQKKNVFFTSAVKNLLASFYSEIKNIPDNLTVVPQSAPLILKSDWNLIKF